MLRVAMFGLLVSGAVGCGGINASHTITPASFFLPGLGQVTQTNAPGHTMAAVTTAAPLQ